MGKTKWVTVNNSKSRFAPEKKGCCLSDWIAMVSWTPKKSELGSRQVYSQFNRWRQQLMKNIRNWAIGMKSSSIRIMPDTMSLFRSDGNWYLSIISDTTRPWHSPNLAHLDYDLFLKLTEFFLWEELQSNGNLFKKNPLTPVPHPTKCYFLGGWNHETAIKMTNNSGTKIHIGSWINLCPDV